MCAAANGRASFVAVKAIKTKTLEMMLYTYMDGCMCKQIHMYSYIGNTAETIDCC